MAGLAFVKNYGGQRIGRESNLLAPLFDDEKETDGAETQTRADLNIETEADDWQTVNPQLPKSWRVQDFASRPVRFIDGKDRGETVACLRGLQGYIVPIRLAEIGSVVMENRDGELRRGFAQVERVVTMDTSPFPWEEVETFALALRKHNLRLLAANKLDINFSFDWEKVRRAAEWRSTQEMEMLEEFAVAQNNTVPTIVDGPLKRLEGSFDLETSPVFGVVKTYRETFLHQHGQQILYSLDAGERTPVFSLEYDITRRGEEQKSRLPLVMWYVRICETKGVAPNVGLVRVEVSQKWFLAQGYGTEEKTNAAGTDFINQLSRTIYEYRCRHSRYSRAEISLEPIVRAEESLGALFAPRNALKSKFYHLTGL